MSDFAHIDFRRLEQMGKQVLNPVPVEEVENYRFWRAAHLGKLLLGLYQGNDVLNNGDGNVMHFFDGAKTKRLKAHQEAINWATHATASQLTREDTRELRELTGTTFVGSRLPRIVFALDTKYNSQDLMPPQDDRPGVSLTVPITLQDIDKYSNGAISNFASRRL
jgi:hypothetical protein